MSLEVSVPEPPSLETGVDASEYDDADVVGNDDYKRAELSEYLRSGAWAEAFDQWAESTQLSQEEYEIVRDLGLLERFDFFWDDFAGRVGYHAPGLPEDWKEREIHPDLTSWSKVSSINASLTELGETVADVLKQEYIDWEAEFEAPDDLPEFE